MKANLLRAVLSITCLAAVTSQTGAAVQQAYVKASNTGSPDNFGYAVAMFGDMLVVGARYEASAATGINGDQGNNVFSSSGAVYIFVRMGTNWSQQAYVKASNT